MRKHRTIHDKNRTSSYRIKLGNVVEDVHIVVDDESGAIYYDGIIPKERLKGVTDLYFHFIDNKIKWSSNSEAIIFSCGEFQKRPTTTKFTKKCCGRIASDEYYVISLCNEILGEKASQQHTFDFLRGDSGTKLHVDAYYAVKNLVVEYCESQHTESTPFFDHNDKLTVSGVPRGEQRKIYDQRRRVLIPQHGIDFVEIHYNDFGSTKKIRRNHEHDIEVVKEIFKKNGLV